MVGRNELKLNSGLGELQTALYCWLLLVILTIFSICALLEMLKSPKRTIFFPFFSMGIFFKNACNDMISFISINKVYKVKFKSGSICPPMDTLHGKSFARIDDGKKSLRPRNHDPPPHRRKNGPSLKLKRSSKRGDGSIHKQG